ncbi:unnamed protein product [Cyclocybe aegerita]|uniref:Uncharacterized protein n=1 Tax=Cyclocybe aegerita TaxID=1973307 RepID=A0A8S0WAA6_CYCAE|nr:unnamed protein product [Cyclocybe aegerita]
MQKTLFILLLISSQDPSSRGPNKHPAFQVPASLRDHYYAIIGTGGNGNIGSSTLGQIQRAGWGTAFEEFSVGTKGCRSLFLAGVFRYITFPAGPPVPLASRLLALRNLMPMRKLKSLEMSQLPPCGDSCGPFAPGHRMELGVCTPTVWGSLEGCESPRMLARCLLDCLVGFAKVYLTDNRAGGIPLYPLAISNRNLLRRLEKEVRPHTEVVRKDEDWFHSDEMQFLSNYLNECYAFILDVEIEAPLSETRMNVKEFLGAIAFLPTRILRLLTRGEPIIYTTIDRLESFSWVLLWIAFRKDPKHRESEVHLTDLNRKAVRNVVITKSSLMDNIADEAEVLHFPLSVQAIQDLFKRWIAASRKATAEVSRVFEDERFTLDNLHSSTEVHKELKKALQDATKECLKEYMRAAVDFIEGEGEELTIWPDPSA